MGRSPLSEKIPVTVLTGFLGSGKTTLLNGLLHQPALATALVIVNEFGEIGLDHDLIETSQEDTILLQSGCLCCTIRNDLIETLHETFLRRARGDIPPFDRVVIETTGLADPAPILQVLMTDSVVTQHFRLDGVISTVDAIAGAATLDRHIEAVKQAAVADHLVLTKTDLVQDDDCFALEQRLRMLNPGAPIQRAAKGDIDAEALFDAGIHNVLVKDIDVRRWLDDEKYTSYRHRHDEGHSHGAHDVNRHDKNIHAVCILRDRPIAGEALDHWLKNLLRLNGPDLLRFKAIINLADAPGPLVVQGVQHVIYPPIMLPQWPSADRRTRMVFITYGIDEKTIRDTWDQAMNEASAAVA